MEQITIQHSDRVKFKKEVDRLVDMGFRVVEVAGARMRVEDWHFAVLEKDGDEKLQRIAEIIAGKKRMNLTAADYDEIRLLVSGTDDV